MLCGPDGSSRQNQKQHIEVAKGQVLVQCKEELIAELPLQGLGECGSRVGYIQEAEWPLTE